MSSSFPVGKTLASFDFAQVPGLARQQIEALAGSSDWTRQARNVLLFVAGGVGKTHLAGAIGHPRNRCWTAARVRAAWCLARHNEAE